MVLVVNIFGFDYDVLDKFSGLINWFELFEIFILYIYCDLFYFFDEWNFGFLRNEFIVIYVCMWIDVYFSCDMGS